MDMFEFGTMAGLGITALLLFLIAWTWAIRSRRSSKQMAVSSDESASGVRKARSDARIVALETLQADLAARIDALASAQNEPEERLQALAGQILSLIRDKNATLETALAGLDQLRARMRMLEQVGNLAETRELLDDISGRLEALQSSHSADLVVFGRRIDRLETPGENPFAEISAQLTQLYTQKDAAIEAVLNRVGPLERRLAEIEGGAPVRDLALEQIRSCITSLQEVQEEQRDALSALCAGVTDTQALADGITALRNQKAEIAHGLVSRLEALEQKLAERDPEILVGRVSERLEALREMHAVSEAAVKDRLAALENPGESPFSEISEQLTRLYAQKDATVETVFARLQPLEARLAELGAGAGIQDAESLLARFTERLEALKDRVSILEAPGESPFAEISEQLTRLYAQKDATVETVFARLQPLEAKLEDLSAKLAAQDPQVALARLADRIEALRSAHAAGERMLDKRVSALETPETSPFLEISEQLTRLYAQKDATREAVLARLAPLEAQLPDLARKVAAQDSQILLERFSERLETLREMHAMSEAAVKDRLAALENPGQSPFADISEQLANLYAQKDATVETMFARLQPLEAKLDDLEAALSVLDPRQGIADLQERIEDLDGRQVSGEAILSRQIGNLAEAQAAARSDFAALRAETISVDIIAQRLEGLHAQKDALSEALMSRMRQIEETMAASNPRAVLDRFSERLDALKERVVLLEAPGESPFAEISEQLTRLYAQKDATVETVFARLVPLEAKLDALETGVGGAARRDQVEGLAARLDALDWVQDELADRLGGIRAAAEDQAMQAVSGQMVPMQARLAEMEGLLAAQDPRAVLDRFSERLDALKERVVLLEAPGESPFAEISEQLTRLYAQKDATVETVFARLAPLEAKLDALETGVGGAAGRDQVEGLAARLDALAYAQESASERLTVIGTKAAQIVPMAEIRKELAQAFAGRDANINGLLKRLTPLEKRLAELEARPWDPDADEARARAQEVAMQLIAARAAAQHTELFADRLALLEATLPRLSATQTILMQTLERKAGASEMAGRIVAALNLPAQSDGNGGADADDDFGAIQAMPRVISLHQK
jgi:hypothetical protein